MKARKMIRTRRLGFEGLEGRAMLATVNVSGGILFIEGNNTAETVTVAEVTPGTVAVTGTGIIAPIIRTGITGIVANMRGGGDTLNIGSQANSVDLTGSVSILLANGADRANLFINTPAAVAVDGGYQPGAVAQNDQIRVRNSNIGTLAVNTYAGDDLLAVQTSTFGTLVANLGLPVLNVGQTDADTFSMAGGGAETAAIILGTAEIGAQNAVQIGGAVFGTLSITGGEGTDFIRLGNLEVSNALVVNTFRGDDTVILNTVVATNSLTVTTGAGTDLLRLINVTTALAILDGGAGVDTLQDDLSPAIDTRLKFNWEIDDPLL